MELLLEKKLKAPRKAQVTRTYESLAAVHVDNRAVVTKATIERLVDVKYDASYDVILNAIGDDMNFSDMVKVLATLVVNSDVSAEDMKDIIREENLALSVRAESEERQQAERQERRAKAQVFCNQCKQTLVQCVQTGCVAGGEKEERKNVEGVLAVPRDPQRVSRSTRSPTPQRTQPGLKETRATYIDVDNEIDNNDTREYNREEEEDSYTEEPKGVQEVTAFSNIGVLLDVAKWSAVLDAGGIGLPAMVNR